MRRIPSLTRLQTFEVAARLQSFALAAQELNLTPSAVSHQIRDLEQHFGQALFDRSHRRVQTTYEGKRLYESLSRVFDALHAACAEVALPPSDRVLAVHCAPSFAIKWLGPRLPGYLSTHSEINVRLTTGAEPVNLDVVREIDVALSYGEQPIERPDIVTISMGQEQFSALVSPMLVPPRARVAELVQQLTLIDSTLSPLNWAQWFERQGMPLPNRPRPAFDRAAMAIAAAVDGMGVALESTRLAAREIERGELIELGGKRFKPLVAAVHFISVRKSDLARSSVRSFIDWVLDSVGQARMLPSPKK